MTDSLTITIPMSPPRALSPNSRVTWRRVRSAVANARDVAYYATLPQKSHHFPPDRRVRLDWTVAWEKGHRIMDDTNIKASLKAFEDGVAAALGLDDKHFTVGTVEQCRDSRGYGFTTVTLTAEEPYRD